MHTVEYLAEQYERLNTEDRVRFLRIILHPVETKVETPRLSAEARKRISLAQKARWVRIRRNRQTPRAIQYPSGEFTFDEIAALNPQFVRITLRVRLNDDLQNGKLVVVGTRPPATVRGRPAHILKVVNSALGALSGAS